MANFDLLKVYNGNRENLFDKIYECTQYQAQHFHFLAASSVNLAFTNGKLLEIFNSGISIADSKPLAISMKIIREEVCNIRGADFLRFVILNDTGQKSHFFIGSSIAAIDGLIKFARSQNPNFKVAGKIIPGFKDSFENDYSEWVTTVLKSQADIIWVGISTPKQDIIAFDMAKISNVTTIAVGAAFDFVGGNVSEAPLVFRHLSLEWFFRLITEPRRLWRRYLIGNLIFLVHAIRIIFKNTIYK